MSFLMEKKYTCRVSSTLNRDTKQFGKKFMFDNREETCWNSDQGSPQWISLEFTELTSVSGFALQFQGGFAGKECYVETDGTLKILDFYPEDCNKLQYFYLKDRVHIKKIRIAFNSSTDFYGRITLYKLDLFPWTILSFEILLQNLCWMFGIVLSILVLLTKYLILEKEYFNGFVSSLIWFVGEKLFSTFWFLYFVIMVLYINILHTFKQHLHIFACSVANLKQITA